MKFVKAIAIVVVVATLVGANASAQQPTAAPAPAPSTSNWCPGVPESPPPPHWENIPGGWAQTYKACSADRSMFSPGQRHNMDVECRHACMGAKGSWGTSKNPPSTDTLPLSTGKPQGPFPLPGGGSGYVLPLPSSPPIPTTSEAPSASQDSADPPGPFSSYPGADLNVSGCNAGDCQPPDVAADVSPTQNVEFVNNLGLTAW